MYRTAFDESVWYKKSQIALHIIFSHYHHNADLFEGIENACQVYPAERISMIKFILSDNIYCNIWGCVFEAFPFLFGVIVRIFVIYRG